MSSHGDQLAEAEVADFKAHAVDLLNRTKNRGNLAGYISDLLDEHDRDDLDHIDEALREAAEEHNHTRH